MSLSAEPLIISIVWRACNPGKERRGDEDKTLLDSVNSKNDRRGKVHKAGIIAAGLGAINPKKMKGFWTCRRILDP